MKLRMTFVTLLASVMATAQTINLAGTWAFTTSMPWWNETIKLPGSMLTNGKGKAVDTGLPIFRYSANGEIAVPLHQQNHKNIN